MSKEKYLVTKGMIKFDAYNRTYTVRPSHLNFVAIGDALGRGKPREAVGLYNKGLKQEAVAGFKVIEDKLYFKGEHLPPVFAELHKTVMSLQSREHVRHLEVFFDRMAANNSQMSKADFARFMEKCKMPITDRGTFLAYKRVNADFTDCHTHKIDNSPGQYVSMDRSKVDPNSRNLCSTGLHVCSYSYLGSFSGDRTVVVEIDPADVIAVPMDYGGAKMRVCAYKVLRELGDFKDLVKNSYQDCLGNMPFFRTDALKGGHFANPS